MGQCFGRIFDCRFRYNTDVRILMLGLDAAGKTSILFKLKLGIVTTTPTIGFNGQTVQYKNISFTVWDVDGQDKVRELWRFYYQNTQGLIFVVDSNDRERVEVARDELEKLMSQDELRRVPVLVLANKTDLPTAMGVDELSQKLGLSALRSHQWFIQGCCAITGAGLHEGLDWLATAIERM